MIKTNGSPYKSYFDLINQQISDYSGRKSENIFHNLKGKIKLSYLNKEINIISEYYSVFYELKEYRSTEKSINMHNDAILELIKKNKFSFFKNRKLKKYIIKI